MAPVYGPSGKPRVSLSCATEDAEMPASCLRVHPSVVRLPHRLGTVASCCSTTPESSDHSGSDEECSAVEVCDAAVTKFWGDRSAANEARSSPPVSGSRGRLSLSSALLDADENVRVLQLHPSAVRLPRRYSSGRQRLILRAARSPSEHLPSPMSSSDEELEDSKERTPLDRKECEPSLPASMPTFNWGEAVLIKKTPALCCPTSVSSRLQEEVLDYGGRTNITAREEVTLEDDCGTMGSEHCLVKNPHFFQEDVLHEELDADYEVDGSTVEEAPPDEGGHLVVPVSSADTRCGEALAACRAAALRLWPPAASPESAHMCEAREDSSLEFGFARIADPNLPCGPSMCPGSRRDRRCRVRAPRPWRLMRVWRADAARPRMRCIPEGDTCSDAEQSEEAEGTQQESMIIKRYVASTHLP